MVCIKFSDMLHPNMVTNQGGNDRWNIHGGERHTEIKEIIKPGNIDMYMAQEINYGNIELEIIGAALIFKCLKCARLPIFQDTRPISIRNHLSHAHREFRDGKVICPYYPSTFWHLGNLKKDTS